MNARLCFILKYILLRQALYRGIMRFIQKPYFQKTHYFYFYPIIIMLDVIRTKP